MSFSQAAFHSKPSDIYLSRRGTQVGRFVATDGSDRCPRVSPDGDHLAYLQDSTLVVASLDDDGAPAHRESVTSMRTLIRVMHVIARTSSRDPLIEDSGAVRRRPRPQ